MLAIQRSSMNYENHGRTVNFIESALVDASTAGFAIHKNRPRRKIFNVDIGRTIKRETLHSRFQRMVQEIRKIRIKDIA